MLHNKLIFRKIIAENTVGKMYSIQPRHVSWERRHFPDEFRPPSVEKDPYDTDMEPDPITEEEKGKVHVLKVNYIRL